ncbi:MAG: glutamine synthetase [Firmicutes bacterium]|nr:glutamine synthetase [Bacillota bacterium]
MAYEKMLYCIPAEDHEAGRIKEILEAHKEVRFVSLVGVDIYGHDTDEKIPVELILKDIDDFLEHGVRTDGSSVLLSNIADITNARVDLIPDQGVNWYVDYNFDNYEETEGDEWFPVGTLRVPASLLHNGVAPVGSRSVLIKAEKSFEKRLKAALKKHPEAAARFGFDSEDVEGVTITAATELEFYVRTPHEAADVKRLHTSQEMKEQYWKRTVGPVRSALESCLLLLGRYGFGVEMGHKEAGGANPEMVHGGDYDHIMEQLEIDWRFSSPIQACDNENQIKYIVEDRFAAQGLEVSFQAKPVEGIAGSGKHVHLGIMVRLKDGSVKNLFTASEPEEYMDPIGYGALMGLMKHYEAINPLANCTIDALNRLKPGYEAPVSIVCSLGRDVYTPSRNRTVLIGLIRDFDNPKATHFELRSPNPRSNTYLVMAACLQAMIDGMEAVMDSGLSAHELEACVSKSYGEECFYLDKDREYRCENDIFEDFTQEERDRLFGRAPRTVWENLKTLDDADERAVLTAGGVFSEAQICSFKTAALDLWATEVKDRMIPEMRKKIISFTKLHSMGSSLLDDERWEAISELRKALAKDSAENGLSMISYLTVMLSNREDEKASSMLVETVDRLSELEALYETYRSNMIDL